jgi:hypothetical protein
VLAALAAGSAVIAAGDVRLIVVCWRHRAVLAGLLGTVGIALVAFAVASGLTGSVGEGALVIAAITLVVGFGLHGLGQTLERLLNDEPEGES